jgi:hypothetical protein
MRRTFFAFVFMMAFSADGHLASPEMAVCRSAHPQMWFPES